VELKESLEPVDNEYNLAKGSFSSIAEEDQEDEESGEEEIDLGRPKKAKDVNDFFVDGNNLAFEES